MGRVIDAGLAQEIADKELSVQDAGTVQYVLSHTPTVKAGQVLRCEKCAFFMEYTEEYRESANGADGDCYIRLMHSEDKEFCARKYSDYCSDGKPKEG